MGQITMNNYDLQLLEELMADEFAEEQMQIKKARGAKQLMRRAKRVKEGNVTRKERKQYSLVNY